jgi:hypothetical protein
MRSEGVEGSWRAMDGQASARVPVEPPRRRASPPRPSLLCGDLDTCRRVYDDLDRRAAELMELEATAEVRLGF